MISKVNFGSSVFWASDVKPVAKKEEATHIKNYAKKTGSDVFVYDRSYYIDGAGSYDAVAAKDGYLYKLNFSFKDSKKPVISCEA